MRPPPPKTAMKERKRDTAVAIRGDEIAIDFRNTAKKPTALKPRPASREVHAARMTFSGAE